jgi:hypothetical protein
MACGDHGLATGVCMCPEYAGTLVVADAASGSRVVADLPKPTGSPEPPECRFGRLSDALSAAAARAPSAATVRIEGGAAVAFGAAAAEEWPLEVATNVTVVAADGERPIVRADPAVATTLVVVRGAVDGLRVDGGGARRPGVEVACSGWNRPSLRRVEVDGQGTVDPDGIVTSGLTAGIVVTGQCGGARLTDVAARRVRGVALTINPDEVGTVEVLGGSFGASNYGIWVRAGNVALKPDPETAASVMVSGNAMHGVVIGGRSPLAVRGARVAATLERAVVTANGGSGILAAGLPGSARIALSTCDVGENGVAANQVARYGAGSRSAGGILVANAGIDLEFTRNRIWANAADQLAFDSSATNWTIAAAACGVDSNVFACVAGEPTCLSGGACAVAVSGGGAVQASRNVWPEYPGDAYLMASVSGAEASCPLNTPTALPPPICP